MSRLGAVPAVRDATMPPAMDAGGAPLEADYDRVPNRDVHRITVIYTVDDQRRVADQFEVDFATIGSPVSRYLQLDRLSVFYDLAEAQVPRVIARENLEGGDVVFQSGASVDAARVWLVALPHGAHLVALTVEVRCSVLETIPILEDLHHRRVEIGGRDVWGGFVEMFASHVDLTNDLLGPDTYQLIFVRAEDHGALARDENSVISSLIYRYRDDYQHETLRIAYPQETNRGAAIAATGPYVGVVSGTQGYVENAIFISALQFSGSVALLRDIRIEGFSELVRLRRVTAQGELTLRARRSVLAEMARRLGHLRLELSFGVEAFDRISSLIPSLRIIDFHASLFRTAELDAEARTVAMMLERLEQGLRSEIEKSQAEERSNDERRRQATSAAVGLITVTGLPLSLLFGYFGMSASEIDPTESFLSVSRYALIYVLLAVLFAVAGIVSLALRVAFWRSDRREKHIRDALLR